jgi:lactoylglutathione lyase
MPLEYFGIRVTDIERSLQFYAEALGLTEVKRGDMSNYGGGIWIHLKDPESGQKLELNYYPKGSHFDSPYVAGEGLDHIGFIVDDVRKTYNDLLAKGATPTEIDLKVTQGFGAYVKDPDGNWIGIYQRQEPKQ